MEERDFTTVQKNILIDKLENAISSLKSHTTDELDRLCKHIYPTFRGKHLVFTCEGWAYSLDELDLLPCSTWVSNALTTYATRYIDEVAEMDFDANTGRATIEDAGGLEDREPDFDEHGNQLAAVPPIYLIQPTSQQPITYNMKKGIRALSRTILAKPKNFQVIRSRSRKFSRDMKSGYIGTVNHRADSDPLREASGRLHALTAGDLITDKRKAVLFAIYGRGGSKKSADLKKWAKPYLNRNSKYRNRSAITIICPTNHLRAEWMSEMDTKWTYMVKTLETALFETPNPVVILDDISKFPAGYIDSLLVLHSQIKYVIITGDVTQLSYKSPHPNAETNLIESEGDRFAKFADYYFNFTYRSPQCLARRFGITSYNLEEGTFNPDPRPYMESGAIIVPGAQQEMDLIGAGRNAFTYSNSQGLDFLDVHAVVDRNTAAMDYRALNTVYTRAKVNLYVHNFATDLPLPHYAALFEAAEPDGMIEFMIGKIKELMPKAVILNEDPRLNKTKLRENYNFKFSEDEPTQHTTWADEMEYDPGTYEQHY